MNAKELYLAIGEIDDDLILAANAQRGKRRKPAARLWMIAAAACFCLVLFGGYLRFFSASAVWNEGSAEYAAKPVIPADSLAQSLSEDTLGDYYHITPPDTLDDLSRIPADAQIYADAQGGVVYDRNVLRYESADGSKKLDLTLSRVSSAPQNAEEKPSRICGAAVTLTEDTSIPGYLLLGARWEHSGTSVRLSAEGLSRDELIAVLEQLL